MKKFLILFLALGALFCANFTCYANEKEITVPTEGKLKTLIDKKEYESITSLVIRGRVNDKDMKIIEKLTHLESLDLKETEQHFTYFPFLPELKELFLPLKETRYIGGKTVKISDGIKQNTSLNTIFMPETIAQQIGAMPNLKAVGLYSNDHGTDHIKLEEVRGNLGEYMEQKKLVQIPVLFLSDYVRDDLYHILFTTFYSYLPRIIVDMKTGMKILNTYEPNLTDYKGLNILPVLPSGAKINTSQVLDISDVISIPHNYFENGTMEEVILSENLRRIDHDAFQNCINLKKVEFPGDNVLLKMEGWPFTGCDNLQYVHFSGPVKFKDGYPHGNNCIVEFDKPSSVKLETGDSPFNHFIFNSIPQELDLGNDPKGIVSYIEVPIGCESTFTQWIDDAYIFEKGKKTRSYSINIEKPGTILSSLPLNELDVIDSLTIVGFLYDTDLNIFKKCKRLTYLDLGRTIIMYSPETIQKESEQLASLKYILLLAGEVADKEYDNYEISSLDYAYVKAFEELAKGIPSVLEADTECIVPSNAFSDLNYLKTIILPYRAIRIGQNVLCNCPNLETVELPLYLQTINKKCFQNCIKLRCIDFPSTLNYIGEGSFDDCNSLESVNLSKCNFGNNKNAVWESTFSDCDNLKEIYLPEGLRRINTCYYGRVHGDINRCRSYPLKVYVPASCEQFGDGIRDWGNAEIHFKSTSAPGKLGRVAWNASGVVIYCPKGSTTSYYNAVDGDLEKIKIIEE